MRCASPSSPATSPGVDQRLTEAKLTGGAELHQQAVERGALRARRAAGAAGRPRAATPTLAERWIALAPGRGDGARHPPARRAGALRPTRRPSTSSPGATTATGSWRWPRSTCDARTRRTGSGRARGCAAARRGCHAHAAPAPDHAVRDGGDLERGCSAVEPGATDGEPLLIRAPLANGRRGGPEAETRRWPALIELVRGVRNLRTDGRGARRRLASAGGASTGGSAAVTPSTPAARLSWSRWRASRPIELRARATTAPGPCSPRPPRGRGVAGEERRDVGGLGERRRTRRSCGGDRAPARSCWATRVRRARAPAAVVERERERLADLEEQLRTGLTGELMPRSGYGGAAGAPLLESPRRPTRRSFPCRSSAARSKVEEPPPPPTAVQEEVSAQQYGLKLGYLARSSDGLRCRPIPRVRAMLPGHRRAAGQCPVELIEPLPIESRRRGPDDGALQRDAAVGAGAAGGRARSAATPCTCWNRPMPWT